MDNKEIIKKEKRRIKDLCKGLKDIDEVHNALEYIYERVSNIKGKGYAEKYDVMEIFHSKTLKTFGKKFGKGHDLLFEFVKYEKAPNNLVIIYNEFEKHNQTHIDMYITK